MAESLSRRTKCSGPRSQLRSWAWCFLLQCLPCVLSKCVSDVDINVSVYPQGDIHVKYGDPLEMFCVTDGKRANSSHLQFTLSNKPLHSEVVNITTRRLFISKPQKQSAAYYCQNTNTSRICTSRVLVDSPPGDVTDFSCLSSNMESLNCSWTIPPLLSTVNYDVTFSIKNNRVTPSCQASEVGLTRYCNWATNSTPRYRQQEEEQHFYLKGCSVFGCNSQNFSIDHFSIVKPRPPEDLKKLKYDAHSVLLKWKIPNNIIDFLSCGVDHIIEYQIAKVDNRTHFRRVDTTGLPAKNKTYRFNLTDLPYAYMTYDIRIYIKSKRATDKRYWSEKSFVVFTTASEIPNRPPAMIAGAFHQSTFDTNRVIIVYWKQLEEWEEAGPNFTYKVLVSQNNKTVFPEKNKSMSFVSINTTLAALDVTVWSHNINGSSVNSSHIYIPSDEDTRSLKVTSFTKLAYENGTYELSWGEIKNIDNYTLFWCRLNATDICTGRLDFAVLDPHKTSHIIDLPREHRYQFAISANSGSKSSGMSWAICDIWKEGFVMYRFEAHLKYVGFPTKSSVALRWELGCTLREGIIRGYNISYCPIVQTSTECDKSVKTKHVLIRDPKQMNVTIEKLYSFKTYQFSLALLTFKGQKNIENATVRITTLEDAPTRPRNVQISNITYDSLVITWDPPLHRNGIISKYEILNFNKTIYTDKVSATDTSRRQISLTGKLKPFTNYSLAVLAWNEANMLHSELGYDSSIFVRTSIGPPSRLKAPTVKNNPDMLKWEPPENAGGTVDLYQIRIVKDEDKDKTEIINTTNLSLSLTHCEGVERTETYEVRAVNFDEDLHHGALGMNNVSLPVRLSAGRMEYAGPWSEVSTVHCKSGDGLAMIGIFMGIFALIGVAYGTIKLYKKYRKMEDIKPVLPSGLGIPEKDIAKYPFSGWSSTNKDEKPSSDEALLLPNSKATICTSDTKQTTDNCTASDHTNSTVLSSDTSARGPVDRPASTSDGESNSSFVEADLVTSDETNKSKEDEAAGDSSEIDTESSAEDSPYFSDKAFKKNPNSGYVQSVIKAPPGYVQSSPGPMFTTATKVNTQPATTSYVMAGLQPSVFTTSAVVLPASHPPQATSGYVLAEEVQTRSNAKLPTLGYVPNLGPESLPIMPSLPPTKHSTDNSYIQLQSLDSLPSVKSNIRNTLPPKQSASSGYVSQADVVMHKHLNNLMSGPQSEESAILDPAMSPDAYCRFSWSTDPTNDNLHSLLVDSPTRPNKN